jgi:hypothetical protein
MAEAEPLEAAAPAPKIPEPEPVAAPVAAPTMAPPVTEALFGGGVGVGMGAPTPVSFARHLARRPPQERKSVVDDLNGRVGNRRVTRMIRVGAPVVARRNMDSEPPTRLDTVSDEDKIKNGIEKKDVTQLKAVSSWAGASEDDRIKAVRILIDQGWVGPLDETALEQIWDSFGITGITGAYERNEELFKQCVDRGAELYDIASVKGMRDKFERDVKAVAKVFMSRNRKLVEEEARRLGLGDMKLPPSPNMIRKEAIADVQAMIGEVNRADEALAQLSALPVGWDWELIEGPGNSHRSKKVIATYSPGTPPMMRPAPEEVSKFAKYEDVDKQYKAVSQARAVLAARNPAVFAVAEAGHGAPREVAKATPEQAAAKLAELLGTTLRNIEETEPKIATGDLDWRDLVPIQHQLFKGLPSESGTRWDSGLTQGVAKDVIGDYEAKEFWITLGLGSLAAAAFIISELATAGMATFLWAAAGAAISAGTAARSWEKYEDLSTAAGSAASGDTRLVSGEQVTEALLAAIMDTAFAFLDGIAAVKGAARAVRAVAAREGLQQLGRLGAAESREAIEAAVRELGAEETIRRSGRTAEELAEAVGHESETATKLREAAEKVTVDAPLAEAGATSALPTEAGRNIAGKAAGVFERWAKLSPRERLTELVGLLNEELTKLGAPPLTPLQLMNPGTRRGQLAFAQWEIAVSENLLKDAKITEAAFADLVNTVTHEFRHGEQWFRMAQLEAMSGASAAEIAKKLGIPSQVAEAAIEVQNGFRKGVPIVAGSAVEAEARIWYESVYGGGKGARRAAYKELRESAAKVTKATEELEAAKKANPKGHPDIAAAETRWKQAKADRVKSRQPYLALAEEVDARAAGEAAGASMRERFDLLKRIKAARAAEREAFGKYEPLESLWESVLGKPNMSLTYDKLLEFHGATESWERAIYAVSQLEEQLEKLATAGVKP